MVSAAYLLQIAGAWHAVSSGTGAAALPDESQARQGGGAESALKFLAGRDRNLYQRLNRRLLCSFYREHLFSICLDSG